VNLLLSAQELAAVTKHLERLLRACERATAARDPPAFFAGVGEAVAVHAAGAGQAAALAALPGSGAPAPLRELAASALARFTAAQASLYGSVLGFALSLYGMWQLQC